MDQTTKKRDVSVEVPPIKQQKGETNQSIVIEKEQQRVSVGDEAGEEEADSGADRQGGSQAAGKKQRGKYRQYENSEVIVEKIRSYRTQRYPDSEIMKLLDNMPRRTYYNYVKKLQEQDLQIMKQWMRENVEHVSEELMIYRETLCQKLREIQSIIDNKNTSAKDRMDAIKQQLEISEKLARFTERNRVDSMKNAELVF
jgi:hypothetical protein